MCVVQLIIGMLGRGDDVLGRINNIGSKCSNLLLLLHQRGTWESDSREK